MKSIWVIPVLASIIVGIAIMLSMSTMPANADGLDNVCVESPTSNFIDCTSAVMAGQHAILIQPGSGATPGCHYNVTDGGPAVWDFTKDHGPSKCPNDKSINKLSVRVRGS